MDASTGEEPPPDSTDVAGWKRVVAGGLLDRFPLEAIVAALQDLRLNTGLGLRNDLAKNLSDRVYRLLRRQVGRNHPNEGWDIIDRVHVQVFEALAQPSSADAKGLRQAFVPRVLFRLKDAIAKEARERRIPDEIMVKPQEAVPADPPGGDGQEVEFDAANRQSRLSGRPFSFTEHRNNAEPVGLAGEARLFLAPSPSALFAPPPSPARAGLFSHVRGGGMQRITTMERAFHLARSGRFTTLTEVVTTLDREGYSANQIQGPPLKRQLTGLTKAARPEPLDRDLSCGVRGN
jgi:hypothetical protein